MTSLPFLVRLIAATILAAQNKTLIAEIAYLRTEIGFLREQMHSVASSRGAPDVAPALGADAPRVEATLCIWIRPQHGG